MQAWRDKVVLVTGGSAGFGLALVAAFAATGARVIAVSRDERKMAEALAALPPESQARVEGLSADVTDTESVDQLFATVARQYGRLDVMVNNVGISARRALSDTTPAEFQRLWEVNFLSIVRCVLAARSLLFESKGQVVNIGSLASKSAAPFLGAYPATKSALGAYSQQLRYEWAEHGVNVLLVCPGPIRREDAGQRYSSEAANLPESVKQPGGGVKLRGLDPKWLARRIVRACEQRETELVVPFKARLLFAIQQLSPRFGDWLLRKFTRR